MRLYSSSRVVWRLNAQRVHTTRSPYTSWKLKQPDERHRHRRGGAEPRAGRRVRVEHEAEAARLAPATRDRLMVELRTRPPVPLGEGRDVRPAAGERDPERRLGPDDVAKGVGHRRVRLEGA